MFFCLFFVFQSTNDAQIMNNLMNWLKVSSVLIFRCKLNYVELPTLGQLAEWNRLLGFDPAPRSRPPLTSKLHLCMGGRGHGGALGMWHSRCAAWVARHFCYLYRQGACPTTVKANNTTSVSGAERAAEVIRSRSRITHAASDWICEVDRVFGGATELPAYWSWYKNSPTWSGSKRTESQLWFFFNNLIFWLQLKPCRHVQSQ